jgi:HlyD family secretion protein
VRQVRNAATTQQSVVSYATIIDVANEDLKLKPGMTANVSIIVQQKTNVLRVENGALRVRIPAELMPKAPVAATPVIAKAGEKGAEKGKTGEKSAGPAATMTDEERMRATMDIMREVGFQRGTPASPEQIEKAKALAKEKGLDPDLIAARFATPGGRGGRGGGGGGGGGDSGGRRGGGGGGAGERGFNNTVVQRTLYKLINPEAPDKEKQVEAISVRLGVSDGFFTEVLGGLNEGDTLVKGVLMPGAAPMAGASAPSSSSNPFSGGRSFGGSSSGMRGR